MAEREDASPADVALSAYETIRLLFFLLLLLVFVVGLNVAVVVVTTAR